MAQIPTVRIKHDGIKGGVVINESDFDPKVHTLYDKPETASGGSDDHAELVSVTGAGGRPRRSSRKRGA